MVEMCITKLSAGEARKRGEEYLVKKSFRFPQGKTVEKLILIFLLVSDMF